LSLQTAKPLEQILQDTLLTPHLNDVLRKEGSGLDTMIDLDKFDDLSRMYNLFSTVLAGIPSMRRALKDSIARRGAELNVFMVGDGDAGGMVDEAETVSGKEKGKAKARAPGGAQSLALALKWVEDVLTLKDKLDSVLTSSFRSNRELESGMNEVCG
jgi:cullin 3